MEKLRHSNEEMIVASDDLVTWFGQQTGRLLVVGAGGKLGPSLLGLAADANRRAGQPVEIVAASRFSDDRARAEIERLGVTTVAADVTDIDDVRALPDADHVVYLAGAKFGTDGNESATWAANTFAPGLVADRYRGSRIAALSTGNVYPLSPVASGGPDESIAPDPVGEYAMSCLGRERMFEYAAHAFGTRVSLIRLNYAVELRYGVLVDLAQAIVDGKTIDLSMGHVNLVWQGYVNEVILRSLDHASAEPFRLNLAGDEVLSVRTLAHALGESLGIEPVLAGQEADTALLSDATLCHRLFGAPRVTIDELVAETAAWIGRGGETHGKPTKFERRDGKF
ncbi:NAD(P)-dependent oxidoreductase [Microbacterium sp. SSW1-49]|uniref:NAD(P)-dependent oxidoreductase n=1 Tax=Microbacterium croceum TaxID=2851645 RepID=A0ABT0FA44_9MICO|nr:NAD(P)-dependent oxidoreductase [Microbacterium croceum]MCK2034916.1 NAD(P)-dependent oxidoreductase [Microbacterium croceum]